MHFTATMMQKRKEFSHPHMRSDASPDSPFQGCRQPNDPSPTTSSRSLIAVGDVSHSHHQKRLETLQRTLSASKAKSNLPINLHQHLFPVSFQETHVTPLIGYRDANRKPFAAKKRESEDDLLDDAMTTGDYVDDEDDWSETSSARLSSPAFSSHDGDQATPREGTMSPILRQPPYPKGGSSSYKLPSIDHLIRPFSPPVGSGYDSCNISTLDRSEPSSPSSTLADIVAHPRHGDACEGLPKRAHSRTSFKDLSPSPQYQSRLLADGFSARDRASLSLIEEPFRHITINEPLTLGRSFGGDRDLRPNSSPSYSSSFSAMTPPKGPQHFSAPGSPAQGHPYPSTSNDGHMGNAVTAHRVNNNYSAGKRTSAHESLLEEHPSSSTPEPETPVTGRTATTIRIKDEWKNHATTVQGPQDMTQFRCIWKTDEHSCGYTAKRHLVKRHIETRHLQIKDHICPVPSCGKAFPQRNSLQIHINRHTGNKPHACRYECGMTFNDPARRHKHMVDMHGYVPQGPRKRHRTTGSYTEASAFEAIPPWSIQPDQEDDEED